MAFPKLSSFDASAFRSRLSTGLGAFPVWDQFVLWKQSLDGLRNAAAATDIFAHDIKGDVDEHAARLADLETRVGALEAAPAVPFPGSS